MGSPQAGILAPIPPLAPYLCFLCKSEADLRPIFRNLRAVMAGSSFVAVQRREHSVARFELWALVERDLIIGQRKSDNTETDGVPPSFRTKRITQEQFEPKAFVRRRSMPSGQTSGVRLDVAALGL